MVEENQDMVEEKTNDKEYNFRALENKLNEERESRLKAERILEEIKRQKEEEEDTNDDPYVDEKRLEKKLTSFEKKQEEKYRVLAQQTVQKMIEEENQKSWVAKASDYSDVMKHANTFAELHPDLADTILKMPDTFERRQLVYNTIKSMGIHKPKESIQSKVDNNRKGMYYTQSQVGSSPYQGSSDFSDTGQKAAYDKMKELQKSMRL